MIHVKSGQIIKFTYKSHIGATPDEPTDDFKEVLVLHPRWQNKMHAIDLKRLTAAEREVLDAIFDPAFNARMKKHRIPLVNDIMQRMDPISEIKNPMSFYSKFVKVFLRNKDAYRTYVRPRMLNVVIVQKTAVTGKIINPKPLFRNVESKKPEPTKPTEPMTPTPASRIELIKQRAAALKQTPPKSASDQKFDRIEFMKQRAAALGLLKKK